MSEAENEAITEDFVGLVGDLGTRVKRLVTHIVPRKRSRAYTTGRMDSIEAPSSDNRLF